jgi:predicted Zn-dependent peptidase
VDAALAALTTEQVNSALRRYLRPDSIDMVFAGDFKP